MQRVRFERVAGGLFRGTRQHARAEEVDDDRHDDDAECPNGGFNRVALICHQALARFPEDNTREQKKQCCLGQCRHRFEFAMAVVMLFVSRLSGNPYRDVGHDRGAEVDQRMTRFRQDCQRAGGKAN